MLRLCMTHVFYCYAHRAWLSRKRLLDQCLNLEQFNHEAEQAESWMAKREAFLATGDVGSSSDAVQALIKKHEDFEKSLQTQVHMACIYIPMTHSSFPFYRKRR